MVRMTSILFTLLLVAIAHGPVQAGPLDGLLSAHADSMGLSRDSIDERCWHVVEQISGLGMTGRVETWAQAPASVRSRMQLGPLSLETWFDGQRGWINDRNGASREAAGAELEGMLVQALFSTGAWLLESPPVPLAFAKDESASTDSTLVIICEPLLEKPLRIELDRRTLLPVGTEFTTADGKQKQSFESWTWHEGVRVSTRSRLELAGLLSLHTELLSVERISARPREFFRPTDDQSRSTMPDDVRFGAAVIHAPLVEDSLHLTVQGFLTDATGEEVPVIFLVDTGAGANFLDAGAAARLGLASVGEVPTLGVGGHAESSFVQVQAARIGEVTLLAQSWMASDFTSIRSWFAHPPAAVLGYDFLSRTILEVDYAARELRIHDPRSFEVPDGATAIPLRMDANVPSIEVRIEGHPAWLHVDTGSNSGLDLAQPFFTEHGMLEDRETELGGGLSGVGGSAVSRRGTVGTLQIGDLTLEEVPTGFNAAQTGIFSRDDIAGILGAEVLSRYRCWFDYPEHTLWLIER